MRTHLSESCARLAISDLSNRSLPEISSTIHASKSIRTERQRLFQALTLPEYVEAWLIIPGVRHGSSMVTAHQNGFSIRCVDAEEGPISIRCSYQAHRRSRLLVDWKYQAPSIMNVSLVEIRLLGDFERTTLELIHFGLQESVVSWHKQLWNASLAQLSKLFWHHSWTPPEMLPAPFKLHKPPPPWRLPSSRCI